MRAINFASLSVASLLALSSSALAAETVVNHASMNGDGAAAGSSSELESFSIEVFETTTAGAASTTIYFWSNSFDPSSQVCSTEIWWPCDPSDASCQPEEYVWCRYTRSTWVNGWVEVDASDFASSATMARLETVIDPARGFIDACTTDEVTGWSCGPGAGGPVSIQWSRTNDASGKTSGHMSQRAGKYMFRQSGTWRTWTASFTGTFFGASVQGSGWIGAGNHVTIERLQVGP
ncbi:MAG: hypothetical protein IT384_25340 [Deltaproteobacteria bacterium]|nr:hypothetical protein [Deltaproteobacteria bacterium]